MLPRRAEETYNMAGLQNARAGCICLWALIGEQSRQYFIPMPEDMDRQHEKFYN